MTTYQAPLDEIRFILNDILHIDHYNNLPGFSDAPSDVRDAIFHEAARLSEEILHPLNPVGHREGCVRNEDGDVSTPKGFRNAFRCFAEGGWIGLSWKERMIILHCSRP